MAHYAFLDKNNVVTEVITGVDETELIEGLTPEEWYGNFRGQVCKRTSYNTLAGENKRDKGIAFRKNYAGIGFTYDEKEDAFIPPQPYPSWILDKDIFLWNPPTPAPDSRIRWYWDEDTLSWKDRTAE
jgi:hypothetical protein